MGRLYNMVLCPFHGDKDPSLAIYKDEKGYNFYCWGCRRSGTEKELAHTDIHAKTNRSIPKEYTEHRPAGTHSIYDSIQSYNDREYTSGQTKFLREHGVQPIVAKKYGIYPVSLDKLFIPIYNYVGSTTGGQIRETTHLRPKYVLLPPKENNIYPSVAVIDQTFRLLRSACNTLMIVESVFDALYIETLYDCPVIALLGHKLKNIGEEVFLKSLCINRIEIFFDDDAIGDAHNIADTLYYYYGYQVVVHQPAKGCTVYQSDYLGDNNA